MARGGKTIDGQLTFEMCLKTSNYVCQANELIGGKQALSLNSAKIIRAAIMQVVKEDSELRPYKITIADLANLLRISKDNIYRDIDKITDDILSNPVFVKAENGKKTIWIKIPWVTRCEYNSDVGLAIKLNEELKPYLINLKENYTQYPLESVLAMKSTYAIRIYELLQQRMMMKVMPKEGVYLEFTLQEIKECCSCEDKYEKFSHLKARVIDVAVKEIQEKTLFTLDYNYIKQKQSVTGIIFHMNMKYHR